MSEVISFRLNVKNPREKKASEVIETWEKRGFSVRQTMTEALLLLESQVYYASCPNMSNISETIDRLARLVDKLEGQSMVIKPDCQAMEKLNDSFISAMKLAAKPGMGIRD